MDSINHVDLAFVVDTTGSMGPFIATAQTQMLAMVEGLASAAKVSMRIAVVQYRDHPPQDQFLCSAAAFSFDRAESQKAIQSLHAQGGGDGPEAVLDGVMAACRDLEWRPHARRLAVLVGDAPPHGVGFPGDGFPGGCPCGQTIESVTSAAEEHRVTLYALGLTHHVAESFGKLAAYTGGRYFAASQGAAAMDLIKNLIEAEFSQLELDQSVLAAWAASADFLIEATAVRLNRTLGEISASITRLSSRRLLERPQPSVVVA